MSGRYEVWPVQRRPPQRKKAPMTVLSKELPDISADDAKRFWRKVRPMASGCWEWQGGKGSKGYGKFWLGGCKSAHRVAYASIHGQVPDGLYVLHRCDNPACCRPDHLFLGTNEDNMADMNKKGRLVTPSGEDHGNAILTVTDVREIRDRYVSGTASVAEMADEYGVAVPTIYAVISRRIWKEVV